MQLHQDPGPGRMKKSRGGQSTRANSEISQGGKDGR